MSEQNKYKTGTYNIKGMHCASCAHIIESTLKNNPAVLAVEVNVGTETAKITHDEQKTDIKKLSNDLEKFGYSLHNRQIDNNVQASAINQKTTAEEMGMSAEEHAAHLGLSQTKKEKLEELHKLKIKVMSILPLAGVTTFIMIAENVSKLSSFLYSIPFFETVIFYLVPVMALYSLFYVGEPYLIGLYRFLRYGKANMDSLIGLGTSVAFIYSIFVIGAEIAGSLGKIGAPILAQNQNVYFDVTIVVIAFITLGKYLEARSKLKTGDAIEKLLGLQAKSALVIRNGKEVEIPVTEVVHGDLIIIKPAQKIPVDGVVTEGSSYVNEAMITGEPMPSHKKPGDAVVGGTLNTSGSFIFKATRIGSETMLSRIIKMVEQAQATKAPIQALADKISAIFVPAVLAIAFLTALIWIVIGGLYIGYNQALSLALVSFVSILVIACPCALGLATPTAIIVGVGKGAKEGILIKDASTLEKLHQVTILVMDKTGTITFGHPQLVSLKNLSGKSDDEIISLMSSLEKKSEHPIAQAILEAAVHSAQIPTAQNFEALKGKGVTAFIDGIQYYLGNSKLISDLSLSVDLSAIETETKSGRTPIILATKQAVLAIALVADTVKPEAVQAISKLHKMNIKTVMLTGDDKNTAQAIARQIGIDEVVAEVLPEDKLIKIRQLQQAGNIVAMAGDGVNDAPALAQADVGIAMATGTDVAIESAGITLLHGDISKLVKAINLSKITMRGIKQNLFWAFIYNIIGIPLAGGLFYPLFGVLLSPVFAGLAMAFSSVSVVTNSLRIKAKKI